MNLEIGTEIEKDGIKYCLIDLLELNSKKYALFSLEKRKKRINFAFFEIFATANGYNFEKVTDVNINNLLLEKFERSNNERG